MIKNIFYKIALLLFLSVSINAQQLSKEYIVDTKELAYEIVLQITGLDSKQIPMKSLSDNKMIVLDSLQNENLPFLNKKFNGKEVWRVTLPNITLNLSKWEDSYIEKQIKKTYIVSIDAETGNLIKIIAQKDTTKSFFYDIKTIASAEKELLGAGEEFTDVTTESPNVTMFEALDAAVPSNPLMAEEIHIVCVMQSIFKREPRLVWCISANNIPDNSNLGTYVRSVVDATTGKLLYFGNYP